MQDIAALTAERERLLARIAEIDALIAAGTDTATSLYTITETTDDYGTTYVVVRTDGSKDMRTASYRSRAHAELHAEFCERTSAHYRISLKTPRAGSIHATKYWEITGSRQDDPKELRHKIDVNHQVQGNWPEGTRPVDLLVHFALQHDEGTDVRIAAKAEADAVAAAEATVREARSA